MSLIAINDGCPGLFFPGLFSYFILPRKVPGSAHSQCHLLTLELVLKSIGIKKCLQHVSVMFGETSV